MSRLIRTPGQNDACRARPRGVSASGVVRPQPLASGRPTPKTAAPRTSIASSHAVCEQEALRHAHPAEVDSRTVATSGKAGDGTWRHHDGTWRDSMPRRRAEREVSCIVVERRLANGREWVARPSYANVQPGGIKR